MALLSLAPFPIKAEYNPWSITTLAFHAKTFTTDADGRIELIDPTKC